MPCEPGRRGRSGRTVPQDRTGAAPDRAQGPARCHSGSALGGVLVGGLGGLAALALGLALTLDLVLDAGAGDGRADHGLIGVDVGGDTGRELQVADPHRVAEAQPEMYFRLFNRISDLATSESSCVKSLIYLL